MYIIKPGIIRVYETLLHKEKRWVPPGVSLMAARKMWMSTKGENSVVAIIDTGVDYMHPDLKNSVIGGVSFVTGESDYMDLNGHGTHVAGIIAANGALLGTAPEAKILAVKVLNKDGFGSYGDIVQGINWSRNWKGDKGERVNVINMSLGGPFPNNSLHQEIAKAVEAGITVVCAAGNAGDADPDTREISYPAYYQESMAVGAVDLKTGIADFSNSNDRIDIVAPGVQTYSTYPGGRYVELSGTSMASPHIAGAAALIYSRSMKRFGKYPLPNELKHLFKYQSIDMGEAGFDTLYGYGMFSFNIAGGKAITLAAGKQKYSMNNREYTLRRSPISRDGVVYVPIDELCELLIIDYSYIPADGSSDNGQELVDIWD